MYSKRPTGEIVAASRLVNILLGKGYALSVHDGEEWACVASCTESVIMEALGNTDLDTIRVRTAKGGEKLGTFSLIWGNDPYGTELVADHTLDDAGVMEALWEEWSEGQQAWADRRIGVRG